MLQKLTLCVAAVLLGLSVSHCQADHHHAAWLKYIEGTWTWEDDVRGQVTMTLTPRANGACLLGKGKDITGTFVSLIGWEAATKTLTDTSFHANGGGGRIVYDVVEENELKGTAVGAGPNGVPGPKSKVHVVRDGNQVTVTFTEDDGTKRDSVLTKVSK